MSTRRVVVDDDQNDIQYNTGWATNASNYEDGSGNSGSPFLGSQHITQRDSNFSFNFSGSTIEVYGTSNPIAINGTYDPQWECVINGNIPIQRADPLKIGNNVLLCNDYNLPSGDHQLRVNVYSRGATFAVDRILYTPTTSVTQVPILWVSYLDPTFRLEGWANGNGVIYTNVAEAKGSYQFTGSHIMWYGQIIGDASHQPADFTYSIDGGDWTEVTLAHLPPENFGTNYTKYDQLLFNTSQLPNQPHTISTVYNGNQGTPLSVSYVYVFNATFDPVLPSQTPAPSGAPLPSSAPSGSAPKGGHPPIAAIVGSIIGILFLISLTTLFLLFFRRWRRKTTQRAQSIADYWSSYFSHQRDSELDKSYPIIVTTTTTVTSDGNGRTQSREPLFASLASNPSSSEGSDEDSFGTRRTSPEPSNRSRRSGGSSLRYFFFAQ